MSGKNNKKFKIVILSTLGSDILLYLLNEMRVNNIEVQAIILDGVVSDRNIRIIIISDTDDQAEAIMRSIKDELEYNRALIEEFGIFKEKDIKGKVNVWRATDITVKRFRRSKEPTLVCAGLYSRKLLGKRADLIIIDDPLNEENTEDEKQRGKVLRIFKKTITPIIEKGKIIVVGTKKHKFDLHYELGKNKRYKQFKFRAIDGKKVLWAEKYDIEDLYDIKSEIGELEFNYEYQNETELIIKESFEIEIISKCYDKNKSIKYMEKESERTLIIIEGNEAGKYSKLLKEYTIGVIEYRKNIKRRLVYYHRFELRKLSHLFQIMEKITKDYKIEKLIIEDELIKRLKSIYEFKKIVYMIKYDSDLDGFYEYEIINNESDKNIKIIEKNNIENDLTNNIEKIIYLFEKEFYEIPVKDEESKKIKNEMEKDLSKLEKEERKFCLEVINYFEIFQDREKNREGSLEIIDDPT